MTATQNYSTPPCDHRDSVIIQFLAYYLGMVLCLVLMAGVVYFTRQHGAERLGELFLWVATLVFCGRLALFLCYNEPQPCNPQGLYPLVIVCIALTWWLFSIQLAKEDPPDVPPPPTEGDDDDDDDEEEEEDDDDDEEVGTREK